MAYQKVLMIDELPEGEVKRCRVDRRLEVLVYRHRDEVAATKARCAHMPFRLPEEQESGVVTCPYHLARFDLTSGECVRGPLSEEWRGRLPFGMGKVGAALIPGKEDSCGSLETYPARISGSEVQVDVGRPVSGNGAQDASNRVEQKKIRREKARTA